MTLIAAHRLLWAVIIVLAKSNFRNGGDALPGIEANPQVCPTISEITFGKQSKVVEIG